MKIVLKIKYMVQLPWSMKSAHTFNSQIYFYFTLHQAG